MKKILLLSTFLMNFLSGSGQESPKQHLKPADLFALEKAADVQISPDGNSAVYVRITPDAMTDRLSRHIWLINVNTKRQEQLLPAESFQPRWSPDGKYLSFISNNTLMVMEIKNRKTHIVTKLEHGAGKMAWSPDGRMIAFSGFVPLSDAHKVPKFDHLIRPERANWAEPLRYIDSIYWEADGAGYIEKGYNQIFKIAITGGKPKQLTDGRYNENDDFCWMPDGSAIVYSANHMKDASINPVNSEIFKIDLASGRVSQLTSRSGPDQSPAVSPDGKWIAYLGYDETFKSFTAPGLYLMSADGSNRKEILTGFDREPQHPVWSADGKNIYFSFDDNGNTCLASVRPGLKPVIIYTGLGGDREFSVSRDGRFCFEDDEPTRPPEVSVYQNNKKSTLVRISDSLMRQRLTGSVRKLNLRSNYDGQAVSAWMVTPPGYEPGKRCPAILYIHGGPYGSYGKEFSADFQLLAAAGYVVIYGNPRGSTSYGQGYADQIAINFLRTIMMTS
ncbi:DPP IV N-terminal domain-containing protein [Mucilaginibacter litoreus]|uniref:DPP IV N-terminal domain-containing protein n=1 Tax=Mucilaginibacter litoreus TaxID=1048221 RepID=A0ABW3AYL0_9SPHI